MGPDQGNDSVLFPLVEVPNGQGSYAVWAWLSFALVPWKAAATGAGLTAS